MMSAEAMIEFSNTDDALEAYFGDRWDELEQIDELDGYWNLMGQSSTEGERSRYFVVGGPYEESHAITSGGGTSRIEPDDLLDDIPSFDTKSEGREAHALWLEENAEYEEEDGESTWTEWDIFDEVPPWFVLYREDTASNAVQYQVGGDRDGTVVYLNSNGEVVTEPYIFDTLEAAAAAIEAWQRRIDEGEADPANGPSGRPPDLDTVNEQSEPPSDGGMLDSLTGNPLVIGLLLGAAVLAYYYWSQQ